LNTVKKALPKPKKTLPKSEKHQKTVNFSSRFGNLKNGVADIKTHPWFTEIDYMKLLNKQVKVPFVPPLKGPGDTSQFDPMDDIPLKYSETCLYEKEFADF
jgi:hypothetical protein